MSAFGCTVDPSTKGYLMSKHTMRASAGVTALVLAAVSLAACSEGGSGGAAQTLDPQAEVTIVVGNMPTQDNAANLELFQQQVEDFETAHPNITVKGVETKFDPQTFSALVAGGSMPTTMIVPYTNIQQLATNGQVKDLTDAIASDEVLAQLNPDIQTQTTNADGASFGVVTAAYTMALVYNRALYAEAGLDPDDPPTTWTEVAANAKKIADSSDAAGFTLGTTNGAGGWSLAAMSYSFGSELQETEGDTVTATVDSQGVTDALELLQGVRWDDDAAGSNFLMSQDDVRTALAAGQIGQTVAGADLYRDVVGNRKMPAADLGIAPLPQSGDGLGTLGGGDISVVSPTATANETAAALEWIKFRYLNRFLDQDAAVQYAEKSKEGGLPVGAPEVQLFTADIYDRYLGWVEPYITVDRDHFTAYFASLSELPILGEPRVAAQETYATLDAAVQQVFTEQDTDIPNLVASAQTSAQGLIDAAQQ